MVKLYAAVERAKCHIVNSKGDVTNVSINLPDDNTPRDLNEDE